jgi:RNA polymerase sigma-70 factor, ECF subfamily
MESPVSAASAEPQGIAREDRRLLAHVAAGDGEALASLYDRYASAVFALAVRILRDHAEAEDVVQETFTQVWRQAGRYDPVRATVVGWVLMITRSRALDRLRVRGTKRDAPAGTPVPDTPAPGPAQDVIAVTRETANRVRDALQQLGDTLRAPLELAYFEGLSQSAIAERLDQPLGTIKTRMRTALSKLRDALQSEGVR